MGFTLTCSLLAVLAPLELSQQGWHWGQPVPGLEAGRRPRCVSAQLAPSGAEREDLSPLSPAELPQDPAYCWERIGSAWAGGETSILQELGCRGTAPTWTCPLAACGDRE